jgi:hypothetical protein
MILTQQGEVFRLKLVVAGHRYRTLEVSRGGGPGLTFRTLLHEERVELDVAL